MIWFRWWFSFLVLVALTGIMGALKLKILHSLLHDEFGSYAEQMSCVSSGNWYCNAKVVGCQQQTQQQISYPPIVQCSMFNIMPKTVTYAKTFWYCIPCVSKNVRNRHCKKNKNAFFRLFVQSIKRRIEWWTTLRYPRMCRHLTSL